MSKRGKGKVIVIEKEFEPKLPTLKLKIGLLALNAKSAMAAKKEMMQAKLEWKISVKKGKKESKKKKKKKKCPEMIEMDQIYAPDVYAPDVYPPDVYAPDVYPPDVQYYR